MQHMIYSDSHVKKQKKNKKKKKKKKKTTTKNKAQNLSKLLLYAQIKFYI